MPTKTDRTPKMPAFLEAARVFYADAFEPRRKKDLAAAMVEWADLDESEQTFTVAHLLYLNLKAQGETVRLLLDLRGLVDEVADGVDQALDGDDEAEADDATGPDEPGAEARDSVPDGVRVDNQPATPAPNDTQPAPAEGA